METATEKDTRLFRFGAIVPEEHQEIALQLAELEDRLNEVFATEKNDSGIDRIYFIPTITAREDLTTEENIIQKDNYLSIRMNCTPSFDDIKEQFLATLHQTDIFPEIYLEGLEEYIRQ